MSAVSVRDHGAVGDGVTNDAPAINAALAAVAAAGGGTLLIDAGTYIVDSSIFMQPGVRLLGDGRARITQRAGGNVGVMFEFGASAHDAAIEHCIIDGNRSGNADSVDKTLIHVRHSHRVTIAQNKILNSNGYGVASNATHTTISDNTISNCFMQGVGIYSGNGAPSVDAFIRIERNRMDTFGPSAIIFGNSNYGIIHGNSIQANVIGGRGNRLIVNIAGNVVTRVSGPSFASIKPGMCVVVNGGMEFRVESIAGDSSLVVAGTPPALSNVRAAIGTGDVIGLVASSFCVVSDNIILGGVTFGIALSLGGNAGQLGNNLISGNSLSYSGKNAINVSWDSGSGYLNNNSIVGNKIMNPGNSGGIGPDDMIGIFVASQRPGKCEYTFIDGNSVICDSGEGRSEYWLGTDGNGSPGSVMVGRNIATNMVNGGIKRDVLNVVLDGWGSSATSFVESNGHTLRLRIVAGGAGQTAAPSVKINKICTSPEAPLMLRGEMSTAGAGAALRFIWGTQLGSPGEWICYYDGTPVAGGSYTICLQA
ncbi:glycosyl hydrolase family 28-related protein [Pseudomonas sp. CGJS7]|uniref:glycosyl hydrolase family 28-related protein n=1 Tax=Pseudomonas sp. CGJS7 TaxID=3109348 RepID=UPI003009BCF1